MANTLDESGAVLEEQPDNVIPLRPAPETTGEAPKRKRVRRAQPDALAAVVQQGAQAAQQADAAVSNAVAAGADAVDAGIQAVGAVGNLAKWVVLGLLAWVVFSATGDKE